MTLNELFELIKKKDPSLVAQNFSLEISDKNFTDTQATSLKQALTKNMRIKSISIKEHSLTQESYWTFIDLLKESPNVKEFSCSIIHPINGAGFTFNQAVKRILSERKIAGNVYLPIYAEKQAAAGLSKIEEISKGTAKQSTIDLSSPPPTLLI